MQISPYIHSSFLMILDHVIGRLFCEVYFCIHVCTLRTLLTWNRMHTLYSIKAEGNLCYFSL